MYSNTDEKIKSQAEEWTKRNIGSDFKFRKYQLEAICEIVKNAISNTKIQVVEAPTGSGKSFIGIIAAGVLWEFYKKRSYILASDLSLYRQYEDTIKKYSLPWGTLKGQDNYICSRNGHVMSMSHCRLSMVSPVQLTNKTALNSMGYDCARNCQFINDLVLAARAPVTLMTYALYFVRVHEADMYQVQQGCANINLHPRDFVICDEAHNLPSLIQNHFSPEIDKENLSFAVTLNEFAKSNGDTIPTVESLKEVIDYMIRSDNPDLLQKCCERVEAFLDVYSKYAEDVMKPRIKSLPPNMKKDALKYINAMHTIEDLRGRFSVFNELARTYTTRAIVKTVNKTATGVRFNCAYEDKLIYEFFHKNTNSELLMSATIGDFDIYRTLIGGDNYPDTIFKAFEVPNTFDFKQSPIYYDTRYRMSYKEKAVSTPKVVQEVVEICTNEQNKDKRGIIHTGSYEISQELFKQLPPALRFRAIPYNNAKERQEAIKRYKNSTNGILIGPSCIEGLDFPGDGCRFNIFMKLPYASLADNLVKAKMALFPDWYSLDVCSKLAQGIGRSVRFNGDWANNYILDACFVDVLNNPRASKNIKDVIKKRLIKME